MPNWVQDKVRLFGPEEDIKNILDFLGTNDKETDFDFNKIVPMPKILEETIAPALDESLYVFLTDNLNYSISCEKFAELLKMFKFSYFYKEEWFNDLINRVKHSDKETRDKWFQDGKNCIISLLTTGHSDWYNWRLENWGTKWNRSDLLFQSDSDCIPVYAFQTPWDRPTPIFIQLSKMFPSIKIEVTYSDEDFGSNNHGKYTVYNGIVSDCDCLNYDEIIADTWGDEALEIWKENMAD